MSLTPSPKIELPISIETFYTPPHFRMPGQLIEKPNPPPEVSLIPKCVLDLAVQLDTKDYLDKDDLDAVQFFRRAANYIAAGMYSLGCWPTAHVLTLTFSNDIPQRQRPPGGKADPRPY